MVCCADHGRLILIALEWLLLSTPHPTSGYRARCKRNSLQKSPKRKTLCLRSFESAHESWAEIWNGPRNLHRG